jgi:hypothetical protein
MKHKITEVEVFGEGYDYTAEAGHLYPLADTGRLNMNLEGSLISTVALAR